MSFIGRFRRERGKLAADSASAGQRGTITSGGPARDLANATFGRTAVRCWLEGKGRRWGMYEGHLAAIFEFEMVPEESPGSKLHNFELALTFSTTGREDGTQLAPSLPGQERAVYLIPMPAPTLVLGWPTTRQVNQVGSFNPTVEFPGGSAAIGALTRSSERTIERCWTFRSGLRGSADGIPVTATWTWVANPDKLQSEDRNLLYGGLALQHDGSPFQATCQVTVKKGKLGNVRYSGTTRSSSWTIVPDFSLEELGTSINQLEEKMTRLNQRAAASMSHPCFTLLPV
ncbi:uncharacterized protein A1O9_03096 [Exophiala aquamarina CBS 119918]|uniref:Uncharacterized protein n=1 Tax=Exophiala aquamarina CBS 119918 TaxID=1182545 RepID=A0A072PN56_9EURO|nr:uncharacterized protein A1O9_03096 [Exophiala aquamarina CBS 119918]KEF61529.1 hypothetical protein A1O9_03096 [Exophiala aquamarina CBS 119918]